MNVTSRLRVESEKTSVSARAYMISLDNKTLKAACIVGPEQICVGIFANLVQEGSTVTVDGMYVSKCEQRYRRLVHHLPCKWVAMLILSKDPRILWTETDAALIAGIKRTTETPFLDEWIGWMRKKMTELKYLVKLTGDGAKGLIIDCNTDLLDALVIEGVKSGQLKLEAS